RGVIPWRASRWRRTSARSCGRAAPLPASGSAEGTHPGYFRYFASHPDPRSYEMSVSSCRRFTATLLAVLAACGGEATTPAPSTPTTTTPTTTTKSIAVSASSTALSLALGQTATIGVSVTRSTGFSVAVDLSVDGLPAGVSASLSTASLGVNDS